MTVSADATLGPGGEIGILWVVTTGRILKMNDALRSHWSANSSQTAAARQAVGLVVAPLVRAHGPLATPVVVTVQELWARGGKPDPGAAMPEVKAWIDGVVDAGLIPDDTGNEIAKIQFLAPAKHRERRLTMSITANG